MGAAREVRLSCKKILAILVLLATAVVAAAAAEPPKRVLLVFDEDKDFPGLAAINRSLQETFRSGLKNRIEFYSESLNLSQFKDPGYDDSLREHFRRKYATKRPDLMVAVLEPSLDFLLRHRATLFPGVPIVFCGVDASSVTAKTPRANVTGILTARTFAPTLDIALRLQPDTRTVFVVGGTSTFDQQLQAIARRDFAPFESRVRVTYFTALPMAELLQAVSELPPHSVVLFLTLFTDGAGRAFVSHEALSLLAERANAPVYVALDQYVGLGAVGGHVYSLAAHGHLAAEIGLRILRGEPASSIPVVEHAPYTSMFDWRPLQRWSLDPRRLPPGSVILNREYTFWERNRSWVIAASAAIILQALVIAALLIQRRERRQAEAALRESEERYRVVFESATDGIVVTDPAGPGRIVAVNAAACQLFGYPEAEFRQLTRDALLEASAGANILLATRDAEGRARQQLTYQRRDGSHFTGDVAVALFTDSLGNKRSVAIVRDVTERERAEAARRLSEEKFTKAFAANPAGIVLTRLKDGVVLDVNETALQLFKYRREEVLGRSVRDMGIWVHPTQRTRYAAEVRAAGRIRGWEVQFADAMGQPLDFIVSAELIDMAGDRLVLTTFLDVTARKQAQTALAEAEARFRRFFTHNAAATVQGRLDLTTGELTRLDCNSRYAEILGYPSIAATLAEPLAASFPSAAAYRAYLERLLREGRVTDYEVEMRRTDGTPIWVAVSAALTRAPDGVTAFTEASLVDITPRKRAEAALRESEERFRQVAETVVDFLWEVDAQGLYRYTSPAVEKILGYRPEELVGQRHFYDLFVPEQREALKAAAFDVFALRGPFRAFSNPTLHKDGHRVELETSGVPVLDGAGQLLGYRGADTDVTERYRAEAEAERLRRELAHLGRTTLLSELTSSLAHELNQPLTAIVSNASAGRRFLDQPMPALGELREILADITADAQRAGEIIHGLRSLLKKDAGRFAPLDLNDVIREVLTLTQTDALIRHHPIALDLAPELPPARGDRIQLQQVLLNLVMNGMEAMELKPPPERRLVLHTAVDGATVRVGVRDAGPGIPLDRLSKVFDTFFTTKPTGMGTGLALSRSIIEAHGGKIWAANNPEGGATFWFTLPGEAQP